MTYFYTSSAFKSLESAREAIRSHDYVTLNGLLARGLNPNICGADGRQLIHDAMLMDLNGTSADILLHYGADVNARWTGYLDWTPAHIARFMNRDDIVEKLRRYGANLSLSDTRGWTAARALPCPITRIEAARKFMNLGNFLFGQPAHINSHA